MIIRQQLSPHRGFTFEGRNPARYITVHETGNTDRTATAQAHADLQMRADRAEVSWHWSVDDRLAIQSFPHDVRCWHAGDNRGHGNMSSIAVEVCVNDGGDYLLAMANAATLVARIMGEEGVPIENVVQHNHWSGKNCPQRLRENSHKLSWEQFINLVEAALPPARTEETMARMTSPARGRVSSEYGWRPAIPGVAPAMHHAGIDIANKVGTPVYAAYAGRVVAVGTNIVPGRTGIGVLIANPDGERQYYGHLNVPRVSVGQQVKQGQRIGDMGATGNVSGPHLHFEVWASASSASHRNPRLDFNAHGVAPGSKPKGTSAAPKPPKPSKPSKKRPGGRLSKREVGNVQRALAAMGYDVGPPDEVYGNRTTNATMAYQRDLNTYAGAGLVVDGDWWTVVQSWFDWVKKLQRALPAWRGVGRLRVDGAYKRLTANAVRTVQVNNGLHPDGKAQAKTCAYMRKHGSDVPNPPKNRP